MNMNKPQEEELLEKTLTDADQLDVILSKLGRPGFYHLISYTFLFSLNAFVVLHHIVVTSTIGIIPTQYQCISSFDYHSELAIPLNTTLDQIVFSQCYVSAITNSTKKVNCRKWNFEEKNGEVFDTIVTQWDLVCDRKFYPQLSNSLYFVGVMVGAATLSHLSDRYGRRRILLLFTLLSIVGSTVTALSPYLYMFIIVRFFLGVSISVCHSTVNILITEISPKKYNNLMSMFLVSLHLIFVVLGGLLNWWLKSWWKAQLLMGLPMILPTVIGICFLPESFRWLIIHNKLDQLNVYLQRAAKMNKLKFPLENMLEKEIESGVETDEKKVEIPFFAMFKYRELRRRILSIFTAWIILAISYYSISINITKLSPDPYKTFVMSTATDLIPLLVTFFLIIRFGKRRILYIYATFGGIFIIAYKFYNHIILMIIGKMFLAVEFGIFFFYIIDIFPTVIRNACLGACIMASRIGTFLAPQIVLLGDYTSPDVPILVSGVLLLISAVMVYLLPETTKVALPETIEEVENYRVIKKLKKNQKNDTPV